MDIFDDASFVSVYEYYIFYLDVLCFYILGKHANLCGDCCTVLVSILGILIYKII